MERLLPGTGSAAKEGLNPAALLTLSHPKGTAAKPLCLLPLQNQITSQRLGSR